MAAAAQSAESSAAKRREAHRRALQAVWAEHSRARGRAAELEQAGRRMGEAWQAEQAEWRRQRDSRPAAPQRRSSSPASGASRSPAGSRPSAAELRRAAAGCRRTAAGAAGPLAELRRLAALAELGGGGALRPRPAAISDWMHPLHPDNPFNPAWQPRGGEGEGGAPDALSVTTLSAVSASGSPELRRRQQHYDMVTGYCDRRSEAEGSPRRAQPSVSSKPVSSATGLHCPSCARALRRQCVAILPAQWEGMLSCSSCTTEAAAEGFVGCRWCDYDLCPRCSARESAAEAEQAG
eukprot:TRINITY_DN45999_c0_g1_i1.p1 TRINITY_DN45999_c0_g1~~TRINITY_DN45999_c0_g1_i1.p1  ORF type:complete len:314 (+),score=90.20 TRINITY_DN45999_c0_g1_i1:62-943(+)